MDNFRPSALSCPFLQNLSPAMCHGAAVATAGDLLGGGVDTGADDLVTARIGLDAAAAQTRGLQLYGGGDETALQTFLLALVEGVEAKIFALARGFQHRGK